MVAHSDSLIANAPSGKQLIGIAETSDVKFKYDALLLFPIRFNICCGILKAWMLIIIAVVIPIHVFSGDTADNQMHVTNKHEISLILPTETRSTKTLSLKENYTLKWL